jgi:hypothetical protein
MLSKLARQVRPSAMTGARSFSSLNDPPKVVAVTGAAGNISYGTLFRIASGQFLGPNQRVILHLIDLPFAEKALTGVKAELDDCAFP